MRFRKLALLVVACMAIVAVSANAAQAATQWTLEGKTPISEETVTIAKTTGSTLALTGKTAGGLSVELKAENVVCASGATCKISGAGASSGKLTFTGVTVVAPANCTVVGGAVTTTALVDQLSMVGSEVYDVFSPASGTKFTEFEFGGALCSVAELVVPITGKAAGKANATETFAASQPLVFSKAAQTATGSKLEVGGGEAVITGSASNTLSGAHANAKWGAME